MIAQARTVRFLGFVGLVCCALPPQSVRTVEPGELNGSEGQARGGFVAAENDQQQSDESSLSETGQESAVTEANRGDDSEFVQSRAPLKPTAQEIQSLPIHLNEEWWPLRAKFLGITESEAKRRDFALSSVQAPRDFWDEQTAVEAVSVWSVLCNECHGGRRSVEDAAAMPAPPPTWGQGEGLFFGNRRTYRHVFDIVYNGGPKQNGVRSEMIAWKKELSKEQIWSLLYFLEFQSGGIEGRFPPSLYPRRPDALSNR